MASIQHFALFQWNYIVIYLILETKITLIEFVYLSPDILGREDQQKEEINNKESRVAIVQHFSE